MPEVTELLSLRGRTAVVTGGGTGIGRVFALALAEAGADVVVAGRRRAPCEATAQAVADLGRRALVTPADVTDEAQVRRMIDRTLADLGPIDVLVNNAATSRRGAISALPIERWREVMETNVAGAFLCSRAVLPHMEERRYGRIVNIASVYGVVGREGRLYAAEGSDAHQSTAYSVSKGALLQLTRDLAVNYGAAGITVNAISPGMFGRLDEPQRGLAGETRSALAARTPLGRLGESDDLKGAIVFLASNAAAFVTGHNLIVDGGWTAW
jgi:gluconate 5-dehydrogenase